MRTTRVYVNQPLSLDQVVQLGEREAHYLGHVMRLRENDPVQVFNGEGGCYTARVTAVGRRSVSIVPQEFLQQDRESSLHVTLAHGIARGQHMDYTIQKAVELGVTRIVPLFTEHAQVRLSGDRAEQRLAHWRGVAVSACEQCGRNRIPDIDRPLSLAEWLDMDADGLRLVLQPGAETALPPGDAPPAAVTLLCGPEGGLSESDLQSASGHGYRPVSLGPRTLRTETAALAALTLCQVLWGDMRLHAGP